MNKPVWRPTLFLKGMIVLFMLAALTLITLNLLQRSRSRPKVPVVSDRIPEQKVETTDELQHFQLRKGQIHFRVQAAKHFMGQDGLFHLQGDVRLVFPQKEEGKDILLTAREIVHDPENTFFRMLGEARLQSEDLRITSDWLEYRTEEEILHTDQPIRFFSDRISGFSRSAEYRAASKRLILRDGVEIDLSPGQAPERSVTIRGEELDYRHNRSTGSVKGDVRIDSAGSNSRASQLKFQLFSDRENIKSLSMQGEVLVVLSEPQGSTDSERGDLPVNPTVREIRAREVLLRAWHNSPDIRSLSAQGGCSLRQISESGEEFTITSEELNLAFNRQGRLKNLLASGQAHLQENRENRTRSVQGESLSMAGRKQSVRVTGGPDRSARLEAGDFKIDAETLDIRLNSRDLEAEGHVYAVMDSRDPDQGELGFFSGQEGIFISADLLRYTEEKQRFILTGGVKVWQGQEMLLTEEMTIFRESGSFSCRKGVKTHLVTEPRPQEEAYRLKIDSEALAFLSQKNQLHYQGDVKLMVEDTELGAQDLYVKLNAQDQDLESMIARGDVHFKLGAYNATSEEAFFDIKNELIELLGNPVLVDKERGRVRGDKLTFHLADDRIIVENSGRERSKTVIRS